MPPVLKKQIGKARESKSFFGYVKLIPLLFFVGFLIVGWVISFAALKIFKPASGTNNSCASGIPAVFAGGDSGESCESCSSSCGSSCLSDQACCGSTFGCGEGCDTSGDYSGEGGGCSSGAGNCWGC